MIKVLLLSLAFASTAALPAFAAQDTTNNTQAQTPAIGQPAPPFNAKTISGAVQSTATLKGKIVVLEWTNPECPFVKKHYESGNMQKLQAYAAEKGVVWLSINSSAPGKQGHLDKEAQEALSVKERAAPLIVDEDGSIGRLYHASTTPHLFVIDQDGNLAYMGAIDDKPTFDKADIKDARNYVKDAIDALLAGKKPETSTSKPYGCPVKY